MKKQILDALKAKFTGVSEAILNRIAEKLAKTVTKEEDVATAVEGVTFQQVLDSYGDSRATEAQQTAVRNYEQKYNLKDGKAIEGGGKQNNQQQPTDGDTPQWAKDLIQQNQQLTERLNKMELERTSTSRREELNAIVAKLPENLRKAYARVSVDKLSDEEFAQLKTDVESEVASISNDLNARGAVFGMPNKPTGKQNAGGGSAKEATDAEADAVVGKMNL